MIFGVIDLYRNIDIITKLIELEGKGGITHSST